MIKNIFFDFDGVITESVNVKTEAFYKMYLPFGESVAQKVKKHHLENGGMSRFLKFHYYHKTFLNLEIDENEIQKLADEFSNLVLDGVINSPLVPGVIEFLETNFQKMKFWVISGTPSDEIKVILDRKKLAKYFINAFGSPQTKIELTEFVITQNNLNKNETVFIGDALADYDAAIKNDISFILRNTNENTKLFLDKNNILLKIDDFINFEEKINSI